MTSKVMSLKAKIRNYAKKNNIAAQVVLQNYMFERFLFRLSKSAFKDKFAIKGGMLIAAIVGLETRSTMDLDTTLRGLPLTEDQIRIAVDSIGSIHLDDDVGFHVVTIEPIRKDDLYGGYRVRMEAIYDTILTPLSIDVSTGDIITPGAIQYEFTCTIKSMKAADCAQIDHKVISYFLNQAGFAQEGLYWCELAMIKNA